MMSALSAGMCLPRWAASSFQNGRMLLWSSFTQSECATPALSDHCWISAQRPAASTATVNVAVCVVALPATSVAVRLIVCGPAPNDHAGPLTPPQFVEPTRPESASDAVHVIATVSATPYVPALPPKVTTGPVPSRLTNAVADPT